MITGRIRAASPSSRHFSIGEKNNNVNYIAWNGNTHAHMNGNATSNIIMRNGSVNRQSRRSMRVKKTSIPAENRDGSKSPCPLLESRNDDNSSTSPPNDSAHLLLNVGGTSYRIRESTIQFRCASSRLGQFVAMAHEERLRNCDGFLAASQEYFFERAGWIFAPIYDFFASGHLHKPADMCRERLQIELEYWKVKKDLFAQCCIQPDDIGCSDDDAEDDDRDGSSEPKHATSVSYCDQFDTVCYGNCRRRLWRFVEDPGSSTAAKIFAIISIVMVLGSVIGMILGSIPEFQTSTNISISNRNNSTKMVEEIRPNFIFEYLEAVCIVWFAFEYLLRFSIVTNKLQFIRQPLNIIDTLTIVPFILECALDIAGIGAHTIGEFKMMALVMRAVRVMRVARIFKLARYSSGLKSFGMTVQTSLPELSMLTLFLLTAIIFFSTLMYFAERDEPETLFKSIPDAGWWAIVTMTTVGYGDYCPRTVFGKLIASCASISGVLVLAFPITMIVENFSRNYDSGKNDFKVVQRRRRCAQSFA